MLKEAVLLGVRERKPQVVLLQLPSGREIVVPGYEELFFDRATLRDGWIACGYSLETWTMPIPHLVDAPAPWAGRLLDPGLHEVPAEDRSQIWATSAAESAAYAMNQQGQRVERVPLNADETLSAKHKDSILVWNIKLGHSFLRRKRHADVRLERFHARAVAGRRVLMGKSDALLVLDLKTGKQKHVDVPAPMPRLGTWSNLVSLSPDGRHAALQYRPADRGPNKPEGMPITEWFDTEEFKLTEQRDRTEFMAIVDLETAEVRFANEGSTCNWGSPVWSWDGTHVFYGFDARYKSQLAQLDVSTLGVEVYPKSARWAAPRLDVTALISTLRERHPEKFDSWS